MRSTRDTRMSHLRSFTAAFVATLLGGCMMESQAPPPEMGPSGFGWALTMTATPDVLPKDGSSQSVIRLNFRDGATNAALGQRRIIVSTTAGTLSAGEVVTDGSGNATVTLIAPGLNTPGKTVSVSAVPVGTNIDNAVPQFVRVGLIGPDVPVATFIITPTKPTAESPVTFDASDSTFANEKCGSLCGYIWDFGDGSSDNGQIVQHTYQAEGVKNVIVTVYGPGGAANSKTIPVVVGASTGTGTGNGGVLATVTKPVTVN